ncbi:NTP transferase domain-containing protein [Plantactinospora sp. S1510]|uniref:NTP transferase domain-containing protein n=1 Tax=Plantactinospora alkalitolerans TaxID=2789879 RepID=A0ABS0H2V8_9ACTN|nr:sugar phosphate nucleotidyltransferase [Plantactinospora alkalitolerans]MBF9132802.1 NTP transferase domain-containing protein [Plantactinospora alkalitolerans]
MKVVLFCGGRGQRMRGEDDATPKPMVMIGNRPLLWHVMRYYAHFGFTDFVLCLGYGAAAVKDYFLRYDETQSNDFSLANGRDIQLFSTDITNWHITFIDTGPNSTVGERLMRVREQVADEPVFLANYADTLTDADLPTLIDRFRRGSATASLLAVPPASTHHVVHLATSGAVTGIQPVRELAQWENGGYFIFRPEIFDVLWPGEDLVPHALDRLIPSGGVLAQRHTGFWRAVDTFKDRAELVDMYQRGACPWMLWNRRQPVLTAGRVLVTG